MGETSRQARAATFPPDLYWCLLDELPLHLLPAGTFTSATLDRERFVLNPAVRFLAEGQIPDELTSQSELLESFALQGTTAWVPRSDTGALLPFWLSERLKEALEKAPPGGNRPELTSQELLILRAAGLVQSQEVTEHEREHWRGVILRGSEMFGQRNYAPIRNLIHPFHVAALRRYLRYRIRRGMITLGDEQCSRRYGVHNDSVTRFFHHHLVDTVSAVVGERVKPSYVYAACYVSGAELRKHIDREQCEFSVTLCLDFSPEPKKETPWPIRLDTARGPISVCQSLGDGLVYRGTRVPHYRDVLTEGQTSTSIFFHYVRENFEGSLN